VIDLGRVGDTPGLAEQHGVSPETKLLKYDFVLITDDEARQARDKAAHEVAAQQGGKLKVVDGQLLPADA
jgi:hypothetical protein